MHILLLWGLLGAFQAQSTASTVGGLAGCKKGISAVPAGAFSNGATLLPLKSMGVLLQWSRVRLMLNVLENAIPTCQPESSEIFPSLV